MVAARWIHHGHDHGARPHGNANETLWPGILVATAHHSHREFHRVADVAVQRSQTGNYVFVEGRVAKVQPVKVDRTFRASQ